METTNVFLRRREKEAVTTRMVETWGPLHLKGALSAAGQQNWFLVFPRDLDLGNLVGIVLIFEHPFWFFKVISKHGNVFSGHFTGHTYLCTC